MDLQASTPAIHNECHPHRSVASPYFDDCCRIPDRLRLVAQAHHFHFPPTANRRSMEIHGTTPIFAANELCLGGDLVLRIYHCCVPAWDQQDAGELSVTRKPQTDYSNLYTFSIEVQKKRKEFLFKSSAMYLYSTNISSKYCYQHLSGCVLSWSVRTRTCPTPGDVNSVCASSRWFAPLQPRG